MDKKDVRELKIIVDAKPILDTLVILKNILLSLQSEDKKAFKISAEILIGEEAQEFIDRLDLEVFFIVFIYQLIRAFEESLALNSKAENIIEIEEVIVPYLDAIQETAAQVYGEGGREKGVNFQQAIHKDDFKRTQEVLHNIIEGLLEKILGATDKHLLASD